MIPPFTINKKIKSHSISTKDPHPSSIAFGSLSRSWFSYPQRERYFPFGPVVGEEGFEPPTPWFVATCSNPLSYRPHPASTGSVPGSILKKRNLSSPQPFRFKKMWKRVSLYKNKNGSFRGVKWERRDVIIGFLNKTTFSFLLLFQYEKVKRMRGVKLFIILASSYFSAGPPLQYRHRSRV